MAEKLSKTAKASMKGQKAARMGKSCPVCLLVMTATKVVKSFGYPGGMYWICDCGYREKI